jgi:hypothetical protein
MYVSKSFNLGKVVASSKVNKLMKENKKFSLEIIVDLQRYCIKDWGDLSEADKEINDDALNNPDDLYILAAYQTCEGRIYIITNRISEEPGDNATMVCFPDER